MYVLNQAICISHPESEGFVSDRQTEAEREAQTERYRGRQIDTMREEKV